MMNDNDKQLYQSVIDDIYAELEAGTLTPSADRDRGCLYLNPVDDNRCFIGRFFPMEWLKEHELVWNGTITWIWHDLKRNFPEIGQWLPSNPLPLENFQQIHDGAWIYSRAEGRGITVFRELVRRELDIFCLTHQLRCTS